MPTNQTQPEWEETWDKIIWPQTRDILADCGAGSYGKTDLVRDQLKAFIARTIERERGKQDKVIETIEKAIAHECSDLKGSVLDMPIKAGDKDEIIERLNNIIDLLSTPMEKE